MRMSDYAELPEEERQAVDDWIESYRQRCMDAGYVSVASVEWLSFARETIAHPRNAKARAAHLDRWRGDKLRRP